MLMLTDHQIGAALKIQHMSRMTRAGRWLGHEGRTNTSDCVAGSWRQKSRARSYEDTRSLWRMHDTVDL